MPNSLGARRTKILESLDFNEALVELGKFKSELEMAGFHRVQVNKSKPRSTSLAYFFTAYLDAISGVNTPAILIRSRSKQHISDSLRALERFRTSLVKAGYHFDGMTPGDIRDEEVSVFHNHLLNDLKHSTRTYNKHMGILKAVFNWIIRVKDQKIANPFNHVQLHQVKTEVNIITKAEFEKFLSVITPENGKDSKAEKDHYRPWLVSAYLVALNTGLRREEILSIRWSHITPIDGEKLVIRIGNLKVNRILNSDRSTKYIPVTKSLYEILVDLGLDSKKGSGDFIINWEGNLEGAKDALSRSFTHFMKFATNRDIKFGVLRKTYLTKLTIAAGENAKVFAGSSSDEVLKNHYLSKAFIAANLNDFVVL